MSYGHGHFHDGARIAFLVGTPKEFEIGFIYGVRKSHGDESMSLALVLMGVYKVNEDHPGEGSTINQTAKRFLKIRQRCLHLVRISGGIPQQPLLNNDASRIEFKRLRNCSEAAGAVDLTAAVPFRKHINTQ
jgi:hypothetical protein